MYSSVGDILPLFLGPYMLVIDRLDIREPEGVGSIGVNGALHCLKVQGDVCTVVRVALPQPVTEVILGWGTSC